MKMVSGGHFQCVSVLSLNKTIVAKRAKKPAFPNLNTQYATAVWKSKIAFDSLIADGRGGDSGALTHTYTHQILTTGHLIGWTPTFALGFGALPCTFSCVYIKEHFRYGLSPQRKALDSIQNWPRLLAAAQGLLISTKMLTGRLLVLSSEWYQQKHKDKKCLAWFPPALFLNQCQSEGKSRRINPKPQNKPLICSR